MIRINKLPDAERQRLGERFLRVMQAATTIFGQRPFRKQYGGVNRLYPINKALFEAWSVNLAHQSEADLERLIKRREAVNQRFTELMLDQEFENAISQGTGDVRKVRIRFESIEQLVKGVLA